MTSRSDQQSAPFVLSEREQAACKYIAKKLNSRVGFDEPYELVLAALERARQTLGQPEPGRRVSYRCPSCGDGLVGPYVEAEDYTAEQKPENP